MTGFDTPQGPHTVSALWWASFPELARIDSLDITRTWDPLIHRRYDNYTAIDVPRIADIPADVEETMGVPLSFFMHWDPAQFDVVDIFRSPLVDGKELFVRVGVRHKDSAAITADLTARRQAAARRDREVKERQRIAALNAPRTLLDFAEEKAA